MNDQRRPSNLQHLELLIDTWSKDPDNPVTPGRLRRLIAVSVLAELLDGLSKDGQDRLVFKGGASFELRFGPDARASRDIDALITFPFDEAWTEITRRLTDGWLGFTGVVGEVTDITRAGIAPAPQRAKIKLSYGPKPFTTVPFELGYVEPGAVGPTERIPNAIAMDQALLGPPGDVPVLGVHYQIAQKLHACTEIPVEGPNARVHDLYDILLLAPLAEADGLDRTRAACEDTFSQRAKHDWPCQITRWDDWPATWDRLGIPEDLRYSFDEAVERTTDLIARIHG